MRTPLGPSSGIWSKSSYSNINGGECIEINEGTPHTIAVRDSKDPDSPHLKFDRAAWSSFVACAKQHSV